MDAATGLMYVGNGQYYDPTTGRFLTRGALPGSTNPYIPWGVNLLGLLLGAGIVVGLYRRKHGKFSKYGNLALFFVFILTTNMILTSCCPPVQEPSPTPTPTEPPAPTSGPGGPGTQPGGTPATVPPETTPPPPATCPACANGHYNREAAAQFAIANKNKSTFANAANNGSDCTNFISYVLQAGGLLTTSTSWHKRVFSGIA